MTSLASPLTAPSSPVIIHRSPWHSPVPYLFGGLAAMLSLIAFALLILACSFSKHAGDHENDPAGERDLEAGDLKPDNQDKLPPSVFEKKYLVIMAGQANPTFLATPVSSKASPFCSCSCQSNLTEKSSSSSVVVMTEDDNENENEKQGSNDQLQVRSTGNQETPDLNR